MDKFIEFRNEYKYFIYEKFDINYDDNYMIITFNFRIDGLEEFNPSIKIKKSNIKNTNINENMLNYIVFHIGLIEMISYYKATCSPNIIINAGYLDKEQIKWINKLIYNGLGEFLYRNNIDIKEEDLVTIKCTKEKTDIDDVSYNGIGNLISVGGGKDSCVSLELLKNESSNSCFIINAKTPSLECAKKAGYFEDDIICVERILDRKIIDLNNRGFLNGHTPFSAVVAFISYLCAYLNNKRYIVLSNESSANEATVIGTSINHQYSKSFEFENDFYEYTHKYFRLEIDYFSLLRGISEFQIGRIFSKFTKYHEVFKSCNLGSKEKEWKWCCNCSKCLFVYMILSPFLYKEDLVNIFGEDLYEREDLLNTFKEIIGETEVKPFDCVGTIEEAKYSVSLLIDKLDKENLPFLLDYYYKNYDLELDGSNILKYNDENNIPEKYERLVKEVLDNER